MKVQFLKTGRIMTNLRRSFAVPAVLCMTICVLLCVQAFMFVPVSTPEYKLISKITSALVIGLVPAVAVCTLLRKPGLAPLLSLVASALGAGIYWIFTENEWIWGGFALACLALCLWGAAGRKSPAVRLNQLCGWFFTCFGLSIVVCIALMVISSAVMELFWADLDYKVETAVQSMVTAGCFTLFAPWMFLGGLPDDDTPVEKRTAFRKFNARVLLPLSLLLMAVLLVYVGKIVITWTMPVGTMNGFALTALVMFTFFHLTLTGEENRLCAWFCKWGGWLMLPVLIVQQVGVWIRVDAYGLTSSRVLGMVMTALCAAVVVASLMRKRANWFFPAAAVVAIVFFSSPWNADYIARINQESRLEAALLRNGMLAKDGSITPNSGADAANRHIIYDSAKYLLQLEHVPESSLTAQLQVQMTEDDGVIRYWNDSAFYEILGFADPDDEIIYNTWTFTGSAEAGELDTTGYSHAKWYSEYDYGYSEPDDFYVTFDPDALYPLLPEASSPFVWPDFAFTLALNSEEIDLSPLLAAAEESTPDHHTRMFILPEDKVTLTTGQVLHLATVSISHYSYSDTTSITVSGWLLTPETE